MAKTLVLDVSNLSIHALKFIRTGIQEVVYRTLLNTIEARESFPDLRIVLLPRLPSRLDSRLGAATVTPYFETQPEVLRAIERELGAPSQEVWGFDLSRYDYRLPDEEAIRLMEGSDIVHFQGLVNVDPLATRLGARRPRFSMTIYDLIPALYPEYCDDGIARWYQSEYLPALGRHVTHASCISRHTALDLISHPLSARIPKVSVLPLPLELPASPESGAVPRKFSQNSSSLAENTWFFSDRSSRARISKRCSGASRLISSRIPPRASSSHWSAGRDGKTTRHERRLSLSSAASRIVRTGYLQDPELRTVISNSLAMAMLSFYEGYGLPVAQAASLGVPSITTLGSSLPEACQGKGIFVEPHDPYSVAAGIRIAIERKGALSPDPKAFEERNWKQYTLALIRSIVEDSAELLSPGRTA